MNIGLDFDNTIVCHENTIKVIAKKYYNLPATLVLTKENVRNHLRSTNREAMWTEMQGRIYGPGMLHAIPEDGLIACLRYCKSMGHKLRIISHRSKYPYAGEKYDLHMHGKDWIEKHLRTEGLFNESNTIFFCETKKEKLRTIKELKCDIFIDDLPEILSSTDFPKETIKLLYDPHSLNSCNELQTITTWNDQRWIKNN